MSVTLSKSKKYNFDKKHIYYVYILLDPRKLKIFSYGTEDKFRSVLEPFYVGKGKDGRAWSHLKLNPNKKLRHPCLKNSKIKSIMLNNEIPVVKIYRDNLTEKQALRLEQKMINKIGRFDLGLGPLTNMSDGGETSYNRLMKTKTRKKISESVSKTWNEKDDKQKEEYKTNLKRAMCKVRENITREDKIKHATNTKLGKSTLKAKRKARANSLIMHSNFTEDQKLARSVKISNTKKNKTLEEKVRFSQLMSERMTKVCAYRSKAKKRKIAQKANETKRNKTLEEKNLRYEKWLKSTGYNRKKKI
jgi:hypothetical protein